MKRKIEAMHEHFGIDENHKCKECSNFLKGTYRDRTYSKCIVYGCSHSFATDWAGRNTACGMFDEVYKGRDVIEILKRSQRIREAEEPLKGQMGWFEYEN